MSDLRRSATEVKRDHDHKAKWAYGARHLGEQRSERIALDKWTMDTAGPVRLRPVLATSSATQSVLKRFNESSIKSARYADYTRFRHDVQEALNNTSDSSSDETVVHESVAPDSLIIDDDEISAYAISGNNVFATAVSKAEVKYENKVTEKLVKEYEFISREDDHATGYVADVDDFEIIEHDSV